MTWAVSRPWPCPLAWLALCTPVHCTGPGNTSLYSTGTTTQSHSDTLGENMLARELPVKVYKCNWNWSNTSFLFYWIIQSEIRLYSTHWKPTVRAMLFDAQIFKRFDSCDLLLLLLLLDKFYTQPQCSAKWDVEGRMLELSHDFVIWRVEWIISVSRPLSPVNL